VVECGVIKGAIRGIVVVAVLLATGCSSTPKSPMESIVEQADRGCSTIAKRFGDDLSFGDGFGMDDLPRLEQRATLVRGLHDKIQGMTAPEEQADKDTLNTWLVKLAEFADEMDSLNGMVENARIGSDMLIAMKLNIVDGAAAGTAEPAKAFGFKSCAKAAEWRILAKEN
jgi:hypothetical protein